VQRPRRSRLLLGLRRRWPDARTDPARLLPEGDAFVRTIQRSLLVSADNAHGVHPNYADKHDGNHGPKLNAGPVIKVNSNQRYATNSETAGFFRHLCMAEEVPVQSFVVRSDMGCGSTIGPITASHLGVRTVDIGLPTFAMHSIRELCGSHDLAHLVKVLTRSTAAANCLIWQARPLRGVEPPANRPSLLTPAQGQSRLAAKRYA
jgi:hypothetical protein